MELFLLWNITIKLLLLLLLLVIVVSAAYEMILFTRVVLSPRELLRGHRSWAFCAGPLPLRAAALGSALLLAGPGAE